MYAVPAALLVCLPSLLLIAAVQLTAAEGGPAKSVSTASAEHYKWGANCDGWYLVKNDHLNVIEERMPMGTSETLHYHERAQQFFYILDGTAVMRVGSENLVLHKGDGVHVLPGTPHQIRNESGADLRILVTSQPPSHGDKIDVTAKP